MKITFWCSVTVLLIKSFTALSKSSACSSSSAKSCSTSATIVFKVKFGPAIEREEPSIRNSNLFPVKANGEVRFLSVASFFKTGRTWTPVSSCELGIEEETSPFTICSIISSNCSPRKIEIMAGGASFAPSLWSFPGLEAESRNSSGCSSTALITADKKSRNFVFSCGFLPGSRRLMPVSVIIDQLLCLPEPLTPANGFSCSRHSRLWRLATFFIISITSWLWSVAIFAVEKIGAISCCAGATSLCCVFARMPTFQSSRFKSFINTAIRSLIIPK